MGRKLGIDIDVEAPWGSHFAYFYDSKEDLIKLSLPFLQAGLKSHEYCLWITPEFENVPIEQVMQSSIPDFEKYQKTKQIEIMLYSDWHLDERGLFDHPIEKYSEKYNHALARGYEGLRAVGDMSWAGKDQQENAKRFEAEFEEFIEQTKMLVICSYSFEQCNVDYLVNVLASHQLGFIKIDQDFEIFETSLIKMTSGLYGKEIMTRKKLEEQLIQSRKMEALGRLAGGVAHDFNNVLTAIMGNDEFLLRGLYREDPLYANAQGIMKAAESAAGLTRQLLAFSRKQILQPQVLNLNAVIKHLLDMLKRLISEEIELVTVLDAALGNIEVDQGQIEQVILNLVLNARDAMLRGGKLTITTTNAEFSAPHQCKFDTVSPGRYVVLSVSDTGAGLDPKTQEHIFEPFYSTKGKGKGTGLGLSTVYGIVKQSEGCVDVISQPGLGTTLTIYLPQVEEIVFTPEAPQAAPLQGSETILVVEDSDMIRPVLTDALEMHGYKVLAARSGDEALLLSERYQGPIHLMLTDVVMPKMCGRELAEQLTPLRPEMKVLYMSAYPEDIIGPRGVLDEGTHFIQKPYKLDALLQKMRKVLGNPQLDTP
jgi:signal transduction histidine kinase/CheY-like chemotaxis protein